MKKVTLEKKEEVRFGAFTGVFVPTFMGIVGVILFLRLGYIVGSAGVLPTLAIILLAASVSASTGLSLSSIVTNIRIGSGGVYSIISKTLGIEVGGSVGIPLYLAQVFSVSLYLFGFLEAWHFIFPQHNGFFVLLIALILIVILTFISTKIAVEVQLVVLGIIVAGLVAILLNTSWLSQAIATPLVGQFEGASFWILFALFFPAVTGIAAGLGLSGRLEDPKRQIPLGLLSAIGVTTVIYVVMALWLGFSATPQELLANNMVIARLSVFAPLVIIGVIAATFSSALTTFVAAPFLLRSMAAKSLFPGSKFFVNSESEVPRKAILFTVIPILITLYLADLNAVAPIITMFFLITYTVINLVVFLEQSIGLVSFRPTLKIPRAVPLYGALSSILAMFLINALAGLAAIVFVFASYLYLVKRKIASKEGDIRSGLFITFSEWAAKKVLTLPESSKHTWKPSILLPIVNTATLLGNFPLIKSITYPNGTMAVLGLDILQLKTSPEDSKSNRKELQSQLDELPDLIKKFGEEGIFTSGSTVEADNYTEAVVISLEALEGQTFPPNILFLPFKPKRLPIANLERIFRAASKHNIGIILSDRDEEVGLGSQEDIHVWLPSSALQKDIFDEKTFDLALLIAYRLSRNWAGTLTIWMCVTSDKKETATRYLKRLLYEARFPSDTQINVSTESFARTLKKAPKGDIHLIPVPNYKDIVKIRKISNREEKSFFFISDSGKEDVLA